jgi:hypothetical protein
MPENKILIQSLKGADRDINRWIDASNRWRKRSEKSPAPLSGSIERAR